MKNNFTGYEIIQLMPLDTPRFIKTKTFERKSYTEMDVLDCGKRFVRFANTGKCKLSNNCFT